MKIGNRKFSLLSAGLAIAVTVVLSGAVVSSGSWYALVVMATATVWFAQIAFSDRSLTAEEKRIRAGLRRTRP